MTTPSYPSVEQKTLPCQAGAVSRVVRNDNDSNPFPGWDRDVFRN